MRTHHLQHLETPYRHDSTTRGTTDGVYSRTSRAGNRNRWQKVIRPQDERHLSKRANGYEREMV